MVTSISGLFVGQHPISDVWLAFWVCLILLGQCFCAGKSLFVINSTFLRLSKHMLVCINPLVLLKSNFLFGW